MSNYIKRAVRFVSSIDQWIEGRINRDGYETNNKAFNDFIDRLEEGKSLYDAKKEIQKEFKLQIEYNTIIPSDPYERSTLVIWVGVKGKAVHQ